MYLLLLLIYSGRSSLYTQHLGLPSKPNFCVKELNSSASVVGIVEDYQAPEKK